MLVAQQFHVTKIMNRDANVVGEPHRFGVFSFFFFFHKKEEDGSTSQRARWHYSRCVKKKKKKKKRPELEATKTCVRLRTPVEIGGDDMSSVLQIY
jgi:hypothetical protein